MTKPKKTGKRSKAAKPMIERVSSRPTKNFSVVRQHGEHKPTKVLPKTARNQDFGKRLRDAMQKKGVQQFQVADALKIGRDSFSGYARGKIMPLKDRLEDIAKFLGVEPQALVPDFGIDFSETEHAPRFKLEIHEDGTAWLAINQRLPKALALKIANLAEEHGIS